METSLENTLDNPALSMEQAWKMLDTLFLDSNNRDIVAELFKWIPWIARQQGVEKVIRTAQGWLQDLKEKITTT